MKVSAIFVLVFACLIPAHADTQTWDITATMFCGSPLDNCSTPFTLNATMTTQTETGLFYSVFQGESLPGTWPVETSITGTFDGMSISTPDLTPGPNGITAWLLETGSFIVPMGIEFEAGGDIYTILYDAGYQIFDLTHQNALNGEQVLWNIVDPATGVGFSSVPEPSTLLLLTVPLLLGLSKWAQMSLRKLSAR